MISGAAHAHGGGVTARRRPIIARAEGAEGAERAGEREGRAERAGPSERTAGGLADVLYVLHFIYRPLST